MAFESVPGDGSPRDIWLFDFARTHASPLTFSAGTNRRPIWSPDGQDVVFLSNRQDGPGLYRKPAAGDKMEELLLSSGGPATNEPWPADWSSAGVVYETVTPDPQNRADLWMKPTGADREPYPLVQDRGAQSDARISRDGRLLAYTSDESGKPEVYVRPVPTTGVKWRISPTGGSLPRWRADGRELFYLAADSKLMAVSVPADATMITRSRPQPLFPTTLTAIPAALRGFAVSSDGQRFLISIVEDAGTTRSIVVVSNWSAALTP
jgi:eukaryotic-like serine/threonine-protein kinase